ncbi:hypothetical protein BZM27_00490 [Paraburkholderia steynii]|uniref:Uncharacterized protein n=1 Tax=Paraburkholderia steynii TaxID=1245441 RepID=A0A4R0XHW8_9BURK|nr:hypothetical protein BZM27_00490 [Paraburkholderia steynii]
MLSLSVFVEMPSRLDSVLESREARELAFKDYAVAVVPAHCRQCIPAMLLVAGKGMSAACRVA